MRKTLIALGTLLAAMSVQAQVNTPIGVYEAKDKVDGLTRLGYIEINLDEATVPDFSQQFEKDKNYPFVLLPENFQKKPSIYFKGQKATGFVKYQSKMLFVNSEVCKLTEPTKEGTGWALNWENELGKKGKCTLYAPNDSTLFFIGLGSFAKAIGPDSLKFVLVKQATANKSAYLTRKPRPQQVETPPVTNSPSATPPTPNIPKDLSGWNPAAPTTIKMPPANSGIIKGAWMGQNSDGSGVVIKLNSTAKTINYYGTTYFGTIMMEGPTFIEEGVVRITKLGENKFALYSVPLNTGVQELHYSVVATYYNDLLFYPTAATQGRNQMGRFVPVSQMIFCKAICEKATGMFTTGKEVSNFPLNLYQKGYFKNSMGDSEQCHGFIFTSFNVGRYTDDDKVVSTEPIDAKSVKIKYQCGRTGNIYTAVLVYDVNTKSLKPTQIKMLKAESDNPDSDDCYLSRCVLKYVGPLKE